MIIAHTSCCFDPLLIPPSKMIFIFNFVLLITTSPLASAYNCDSDYANIVAHL